MWLGLVKIIVGPFFNTLVSWRKTELEAKGNHENHIENLALRALELDAREASLNNDRKNKILGAWYAPENIFAYFIAIPYWFMAITMDFVIFPLFDYEHVTFALKGETAATMGMIMVFWLGKRTINTVAQIIGDAFGKH